VKSLAVFLLLAAAGWFVFHDRPAAWRGMPAPKDPIQASANLPAPFALGKYTVTPLARYSITGVVLCRDRYTYDNGADLAPLDLGLGWGPMSIASVINELKISQSGRFLQFSYRNEPPLDQHEIEVHSSNTHCLPADDAVRKALFAVKRHELVSLEGLLVQVTGPDGYRWRSSLTRDDTGGGACEVMWITSITHKKI
jgi:hypothetical protein